jgi:hypothetical protein
MLVVAIPLFLLTGIQSESGLRLFSFEPGAGKRLTTDTFELGLDFVVQKLWIVHLASLGSTAGFKIRKRYPLSTKGLPKAVRDGGDEKSWRIDE